MLGGKKSKPKSSPKSKSPKGCKSNQIINPDTGRCVLKNGPIGKKILGLPNKSQKKSPNQKKSLPKKKVEKNDVIKNFQDEQKLNQEIGQNKWEKKHSNIYTLPIESLRKLALEKLIKTYKKTKLLTQQDKENYLNNGLKDLKRKFENKKISLVEMKNEEIKLNEKWNKRVDLNKKKNKVKTVEDLKNLFYEEYMNTINSKAEDLGDFITNAPLFF